MIVIYLKPYLSLHWNYLHSEANMIRTKKNSYMINDSKKQLNKQKKNNMKHSSK